MLYVHKILIALITSEVLFFVNSEQSSNNAQNQQSMSDPAVDIERDPNLVGGFLKGLSVIEAFDSDTSRLAIADVSKATGLDRATCRRLLLTLVHAGYAQFDGKFFSLAPSVLRLGYAYHSVGFAPEYRSAVRRKALARDRRELFGRNS